jgi:hypothetical protein
MDLGKALMKGKNFEKKKAHHRFTHTIPRSREWFMINCVVNVIGGISLRFYITFKG